MRARYERRTDENERECRNRGGWGKDFACSHTTKEGTPKRNDEGGVARLGRVCPASRRGPVH